MALGLVALGVAVAALAALALHVMHRHWQPPMVVVPVDSRGRPTLSRALLMLDAILPQTAATLKPAQVTDVAQLPRLRAVTSGVCVDPDTVAGLRTCKLGGVTVTGGPGVGDSGDGDDGGWRPDADTWRDCAGSAPMLYLHCVTFVMFARVLTHAAFPFRVLGSVQQRARLWQHRPIAEDGSEQFDVECGVRDLRPHTRGTEVDMRTVAKGSDGDVAWESEITLVLFHKRPDEQREACEATRDESRALVPTPGAKALASAVFRFGGSEGRRYGCLNGDLNPIHLYPPFAWVFGFRGTVLHGASVLERVLPLAAKAAAAQALRKRAITKAGAAVGAAAPPPLTMQDPTPRFETMTLEAFFRRPMVMPLALDVRVCDEAPTDKTVLPAGGVSATWEALLPPRQRKAGSGSQEEQQRERKAAVIGRFSATLAVAAEAELQEREADGAARAAASDETQHSGVRHRRRPSAH